MLTNDDGIYAQGLAAIKQELEKVGEVVVIAPVTEQSAVGHTITISDPLKVIPVHRSGVLRLGHHRLTRGLREAGDLVHHGRTSRCGGIRHQQGENVGINVLYSGTVSAATEALILGYTGIALSVDNYLSPDYRAAAAFGAGLAGMLAHRQVKLPCALNVNCPPGRCRRSEECASPGRASPVSWTSS